MADSPSAFASPERLYSWKQAQPFFGFSRVTAWRAIRAGTLPAPLKVSPGRVFWRESDILAWQAKLAGAVG
jgi:predicted DNA-binding transcriptional regulator AlpA